jgi:lipoprotein-anchoring transpeptidase ErfK/SrfK
MHCEGVFMSARGIRSRLTVAAVAATALSLALVGCNGNDTGDRDASDSGNRAANNADPGDEPEASTTSAATISANVSRDEPVTVDTPVTVKVADGSFDSVVMRVFKGKRMAGSFNADKTQWTAGELLEPGTQYVVASKATDSDGLSKVSRTLFSTEDLTLDQQTYPSVTPLQGETVGVGMPVIVKFDVPVKDRAAFEQQMTVTSSPKMVGSWHWMSDQEVHWRPKTYWKPGTDVSVDLKLNSVNAGNGIYGQMDRKISFTIGDSIVMRANMRSDEMRVLVNGRLARTIPITGGKPGWETRSGTKLIVEKFEEKRMNAATVGIQPDDPEYYDIPDVRYAQRVTFTGEFLHAAPWSVSAQGSYNVSHGCVGMSTDNAKWLFDLTHRGDPVEVTGTQRGLEDGNGWTDWNQTFSQYKKASAL